MSCRTSDSLDHVLFLCVIQDFSCMFRVTGPGTNQHMAPKKCFSPEVPDHVEPASSSADVKAAGSHGLKRPEGSPDNKIYISV
jgi:hypothetical protein